MSGRYGDSGVVIYTSCLAGLISDDQWFHSPPPESNRVDFFDSMLPVFVLWNKLWTWHIVSLVKRKPVFRISDRVRLKPACSADESIQGLEISAIASRGIILSRQRKQRCWSVFAVCMKKAWVLSYPLSSHWRLFQTDLFHLKFMISAMTLILI